MGLVKMYSRAIDRLEAQELLAQRSVILAGTGNMKRSEHASFLRNLKRAAAGRKVSRASPWKLAQLGITVTMEGSDG